jgi:hypothetical protein
VISPLAPATRGLAGTLPRNGSRRIDEARADSENGRVGGPATGDRPPVLRLRRRSRDGARRVAGSAELPAVFEATGDEIGPMMAAADMVGEPEVTFWRKLDTGDDHGWGA